VFSDFLQAIREAEKTGRAGGGGGGNQNNKWAIKEKSNRLLDYPSTDWTVGASLDCWTTSINRDGSAPRRLIVPYRRLIGRYGRSVTLIESNTLIEHREMISPTNRD
jgi:hypothetical protein